MENKGCVKSSDFVCKVGVDAIYETKSLSYAITISHDLGFCAVLSEPSKSPQGGGFFH